MANLDDTAISNISGGSYPLPFDGTKCKCCGEVLQFVSMFAGNSPGSYLLTMECQNPSCPEEGERQKFVLS